jgi:glucose-6-phosphate 1-dehydrogenase
MHEQGFKASSTGLVHGMPPEPCVVVILGVAGDLARTTLVPSLYALGCQRLLPEPFALLGVARRAWNDDTFRDAIRTYAQEKKGFSEETWRQFATRLSFVHGDLDAPPTEDYARLREHLKAVQAEHHIPDNVLFHFSVPPQLYGEIAHKLAAASLLKSDNSGWRRLIIEKPFGRDAASARALDRQLLKVLNEEQIYRVDHYLGKETVQNMLVFRFANPGFEPIWNHHYIDHVQITAAEDEGIGTRAGYYDTTGIVRDMVQNHLLQLLCMAAMEPPVSYDGVALRNETVKVLQAIRPVDVQRDCVLGQYRAGELDNHELRAYRDEENVPPDSATPTFAALKLTLDNWRWARVPFYVRTGKRLPRKCTEIIDLQKMNWEFRTGVHEHTGVSLKEPLPDNPRGEYTRVHQDTGQSRDGQSVASPAPRRLPTGRCPFGAAHQCATRSAHPDRLRDGALRALGAEPVLSL